MCNPIKEQGVEAGISENDLPDITGRRIAIENDPDILSDDIKHKLTRSSADGFRDSTFQPGLIVPMPRVFVKLIINAVDQSLPTRLDYIV
jgi:hypothetical protein